ncbi:uncharacterized protein LOC113502003 isoform X3 [Trichoplusia ni]|uniref:Uncharacterized protein LOC113502003 isoform X3 n=1 Tax=Trichoplusia ni TaxID=7111 RepID=A0A7E5WG93_TRINI|nr:uncharacterized protein LOC113502003 isoform X3 [Trichoplusia ni]
MHHGLSKGKTSEITSCIKLKVVKMVNGNYVLYGDRPSSESEIVDDHVHSRSNDRKNKRKVNRTANELQHSLNLAQLDNETDSVKYEKKIKEPRLLRYVPTTDVEENYVTEKFETYDLKPTEERPRRYAFTKKPKNPADGSVNYAYSRSSSSCSSPNGNLPTISEHGEQYGTYRAHAMPSPAVNDLIAGYDTKLDKYFSKPRDVKPFTTKVGYIGSHPDSLYRVAADSSAGAGKVTRVLRVLRWPVALVAVCVALAVFVYFLMPDNLESRSENDNATYWEPVVAAGHRPYSAGHGRDHYNKKPESDHEHGSKTSEIDFYAGENNKNYDLTSVVDTTTEVNPKRKLPIPPVFPTHLTPEVQYGNEKADADKLRTPKVLEDVVTNDSTLKPHITQKPEKPLAVFFKDAQGTTTTAATEAITRAETVNNLNTYEKQKPTVKKVEDATVKTHPSAYKDFNPKVYKTHSTPERHEPAAHNFGGVGVPMEIKEYYGRRPATLDLNFTSGHSKFFGVSIEDAEKIKSTTQSSLYNTRVSPTLPTWRDRDDATTKKYPTNTYSEVQCRSTHMALCRGVLPYDLAGVSAKVGEVEITSLLSQIDYLVASNCSDRVRHFACALLEPECNPPPYPAKMPCYSLCKAIVDSCDGHIPSELMPAFNCKQYSRTNCVSAKTPCYSREFECSDNSCVPRDWMCDGTKDCPAGEDEASCVRCDQSEYRCSTGGCILKRWLCDGYADCPGGEDEHESTCGARHVNIPSEPRLHSAADTHSLDAAVDTHEPGEESAGSAPAPAVRRPNRVPVGRKGENDSSKELLITSDSNNGFKRNYTRRPLPSRLSHYYRPQSSRVTDADEAPDNASMKRSDTRKSEGEKTTPKNILENESIEDVNMGDLGFFEEFEKDTKESTSPAHRVKPKIGGVPTPRPPPMAPLPATQTTRLDKTANKLDRVIDGAALLRKAVAAQAADTIDEMAEMNSTDIDKDDMAPGADSPTENNKTGGTSLMTTGRTTNKDDANRPNKKGPGRVKSDGDRNWAAAHTSPCPSGELRCVDGRCITLAQLCDGTIDCSDHADEDNCYT